MNLAPVADPSSFLSHPARWWSPLVDGRIICQLCPRECKLKDGQHGFCFVRRREGAGLVLDTYGRSSGFCVDPIEKKPLNHFLPGSTVFSFGTAGCNLGCRFCQNWHISKAREWDAVAEVATPNAIAHAARAARCASVAFTYNDPVIFAEYALDTAAACHDLGLRTVAVTAGFILPGPRQKFFGAMDAANVDLKAFTEGFYQRQCFASLAPVLDTLRYLKQETDVWLEVTTLLIPGENDGDDELARAADWYAGVLGPDVPWHFTAFHPAFRMQDKPATPPETLFRARGIARARGLRYVYTGNIRDREGATTCCPSCGHAAIVRDGYRVVRCDLKGAACARCGTGIAGCFP